MQELRRFSAAQKPCELNLPASRFQEVVAADDVGHVLHVVVHRDRELIGPVPVAIADQEIAALFRRALFLQSVPKVDEPLDGRLEAHAQPDAPRLRESAMAAGARIGRGA